MLEVTNLIGFGTSSGGGIWTYVNQSAVVNSGSPTVTLPAHQAGDLLILHAAGDNAAFTVFPSGWTSILYTGDQPYHLIYYKIATSASETNPSLTGGGGPNTRAIVYQYRNIAAPPIDVTGAQTRAPSTTITAVSATTTTNNALLCHFFAHRRAAGTLTPPTGSGLTTRFSIDSDGTLVGLAMVDENQAVAGATTQRTATCPSSANSGITVAFKSA